MKKTNNQAIVKQVKWITMKKINPIVTKTIIKRKKKEKKEKTKKERIAAEPKNVNQQYL